MMNTSSDVLNDSSTVGDAIAIMQRSETGGLPIVQNDGTVVGFISDGDILKRLAFHSTWCTDNDNGYRLLFETEGLQKRLEAMSDMKALDLATKDVVSVDASASAECTFKMLAEQRLKKVPVLREGVYVGTLSRLNVIKALQLPLS
jgi:DHA2 family lincomycin resistance protein-like MFS transporter